jgi:hypothetical protein
VSAPYCGSSAARLSIWKAARILARKLESWIEMSDQSAGVGAPLHFPAMHFPEMQRKMTPTALSPFS